jgi:4-hydroxy-4-methyl-2-oxoglutarate aldolase
MTTKPLDPSQLEQLRRIGTCIVASSIELFDVRLQNAGFTSSGIRCMFPDRQPVAGYAATARIRSAQPPMEGRSYYRRTDWWNHILTIPEPRVVVIEDVDDPPGLGAFVGEVNAQILMALGCTALITNGAVRDLREIEATRFQIFAGNVSVSHAYAHVFDFGGEVQLGGLKIEPGALIHGDLNGLLTVPLEIASRIPPVAHEIVRRREHLIGLCRSESFSVGELRRAIDDTAFTQSFRDEMASGTQTSGKRVKP